MRREELGDLTAFLAVAEERSFTRAAARLGTSQSTLSHTVRRLETRLGLRLLSRTTRNVVPTEAGERLIETLRPAFDDIDSKLAALTELREKPAGTVRLTSGQRVAETIIWPALKPLLREFPDIKVELSIDQALTNIVAERYDGGVRLGEQVEKDMIAVRIGPDLRMAVVAAQSYLDAHGAPKSPQELTLHNCINLRLPTFGGLYAWEFERDGRELNVRVGGQLTFNYVPMVLEAACAGFGLACLPDDHLEPYLEDGRLVRVLEDWCPLFAGYHLYYPSRRQTTPAFALVLEALRYRG
jgi:DNA-binding transcriptional LysR family regulator